LLPVLFTLIQVVLLLITSTFTRVQIQSNLGTTGYSGHTAFTLVKQRCLFRLRRITFAGIELDSLKWEARLPKDKIEKCVQCIASFLTRKKVTLKELQSLIGLLNFACSVVFKTINRFNARKFTAAFFHPAES
jgi:hypothetical protein